MGDEADVLCVIKAHPEDNSARLVYSDWLEEHGQPERAELIRVQCALAALPEEDIRRIPLEQRSADLLTRHGASWSKGLPSQVQWRRGFPEIFKVRVGDYLRHTEALGALAPVQVIRLYEPAEDELAKDDYGLEVEELIRLTQCSLLDRWTDLEIAPSFWSYDSQEWFAALMASPYLTRLRRLSVHSNDCLGGSVCLVSNAKFACLTHLDIYNSDSGGGGPADEGITKIVTSPYMAQLEYFDFGICDVGDDGLCALATSPYMARLKTLKAECGYFIGPGVRALGASNFLKNLEYLDLSASLIRRDKRWPNEDALRDLIDSPILSGLRGLRIELVGFEDADLVRLASRPDISGLRFLGIGDPGLSPAGIRALLGSPSLAQLTHLEWSGLKITDEMASALLDSPQLTRLTVSGADWECPDPDTLSRLQQRFCVFLAAE
jgi:uncharacterized protein (TIGR02996 family)